MDNITSNFQTFKVSKYGFLATYFVPLFFGICFLLTLLVTIYIYSEDEIVLEFFGIDEFPLMANFCVFMLGLIYSAFLPVVRSNFNENATKKTYVIIFNVILDSPIWIAAILTIYNAYHKGLSNILDRFDTVIFIVVVFFLINILITTWFELKLLQGKNQ